MAAQQSTESVNLRQCSVCGNAIPKQKAGPKARFCSNYCRHRSRYSPSPKVAKTCIQCGSVFQGRKAKRYCSHKCSSIASRKPTEKTCLWCEKRFVGPEVKTYCSLSCGTFAHASRTGKRIRKECKCGQCGKMFWPTAADRMTFCSRECSFENMKAEAAELALSRGVSDGFAQWANSWRKCIQCDSVFLSSSGSQIICSPECQHNRLLPRWREYDRKKNEALHQQKNIRFKCRECGKECVPIYGETRTTYCSDRCSTRMAKRHAKHVRRVRLKAATVERFSNREIFERDNWTCQLCHRKVHRQRKVPHPRAPTLDHIVPVSKDGTHERANAQCACFECNWMKADDMEGKQLRLFG